MMRLIIQAQSRGDLTLAVDGMVAGADVGILEAEVEHHLQTVNRLVLVLDGVQFIDPVGLCLLRRWTEPQVQLRGGSTFVRALLVAEGLKLSDEH